MCGIVGAINGRSVINTLVDGLKTLEYRGYDSAGIAILDHGRINRRRASGKLDGLIAALDSAPLQGRIGIGHTRWATHGAPTLENAHPHCAEGIAVVHNGIIENHASLRERMMDHGLSFESETDSEVIPKLLQFYRAQGLDALEATQRTVNELEGQFALVALFDDQPEQLLVARQDCPMAIGYGAREVVIASDPLAFGGRADRVAHLGNGQIAVVSHDSVDVMERDGMSSTLRFDTYQSRIVQVSKEGHEHFMRKEISEQPEAVSRTIGGLRASLSEPSPVLEELAKPGAMLDIVACGTSYYAGMVGAYWLEELAGLPVRLDVASEYRYRKRPVRPETTFLAISQSGETADTLAGLRHARDHGAATAAIVNVGTSAMAQEADLVLQTLAGPEIGVASTKAFTAQLVALLEFAIELALVRGSQTDKEIHELRASIDALPALLEWTLNSEDQCRAIAEQLIDSTSAIFMGRGTSYPLALEGALKLKEISYIHAEGAAAGELKHGPLALIDPGMPVIVLAPDNSWCPKTLSNLQEVAARGGRVVLIAGNETLTEMKDLIWSGIEFPACSRFLVPFVEAVLVQLLSYHAAVLRGTDVDQPRNLAKSVTVE